QRSACSFLTGSIAIKGKGNPVVLLKQNVQMVGITDSPQCRDCAMNAVLLQCNRIHIALDHQPFMVCLLSAFIQPIKQLVLMENFRVWRVHVFGLDLVIERTATKADHTTLGITDRKNYPLSQHVEITATVAGTN